MRDRRLTVLVIPLFLVSTSACGLLDRGGDDDEPEAVEAPVVAPPTVRTSYDAINGVVYRWPDGDWVTRVTFTVQNSTSEPLTIARDEVTAAGMSPWPEAGTFPESASVPPGQTFQADVAWYLSGSQPMPSRVDLAYGTWTTSRPLTSVPLPPPAGYALSGPVTGAVVLSAPENGTTWRHPDDQDHIVKVVINIQNGTNLPVVFPRTFLHAVYGESRGGWWAREATLSDPIRIEPGASATGFASWFFDDALPPPTTMTVRLGAVAQPAAAAEVTLVATDAP